MSSNLLINHFCVHAFLCICGLILYLLLSSVLGSIRHKREQDSRAPCSHGRDKLHISKKLDKKRLQVEMCLKTRKPGYVAEWACGGGDGLLWGWLGKVCTAWVFSKSNSSLPSFSAFWCLLIIFMSSKRKFLLSVGIVVSFQMCHRLVVEVSSKNV